MHEGVFQTDRNIFMNDIWLNIVEFRLFFLIYGKAVFKEEGIEYNGIHIKRGQFLRSYRNLQKDLEYIENRAIKKYSLSVIKKAVDNLVGKKRIKIETTELGTLFTVLNYEKYQGFERFKDDELERRKNGERTGKEQGKNNKKNVKNDKNVFNTSSSEEAEDKIQPEFKTDSIEYRLANYLRKWIIKNNDKALVPKDKDMDKWAKQIDYIIRIDKRDPEDIRSMIEFSQKDTFWMTNILSPSKLRTQFDQLYLRSQQKDKQPQPNKHKTKFHLEKSRGDKYTADELEALILKNQQKKAEKKDE